MGSVTWSNQTTTVDNKLFLRQLTDQIPLEWDGLRVRLVPGSPRKINEYLFADRPDSTFKRVVYEVEHAAQAIETSDMPREYAEMLRTRSG